MNAMWLDVVVTPSIVSPMMLVKISLISKRMALGTTENIRWDHMFGVIGCILKYGSPTTIDY